MRSSRSSLQGGRRPLQTAQITPNGLHLEFTSLENDKHYVEFEIKYLGHIPNVCVAMDTTNRTEVLKIIDRGKKQGLIPLHLSPEHDAILYISKYVVKINKRDKPEDLQLELPLHKIAHVSYVKEDGLHIIAIKYGTQERLTLAVIHCDSQQTAEAVCSLISQCFHLVYTDVMIDLIEETIDEAISDNRSTASGATETPQFVSPSVFNENLESPGKQPPSDISNESSQAELLRDYMWQLNAKLRPDELMKFSELLKKWNYSADRLEEFCEQLFDLYGPERKYLLTGMFPFIPERDEKIFDTFLKKHGINPPDKGTLSSLHVCYPPQFYTRSISDNSIYSTTAITSDQETIANNEVFDELDAVRNTLENIEMSVGEPTQSYLGT